MKLYTVLNKFDGSYIVHHIFANNPNDAKERVKEVYNGTPVQIERAIA